MADGTQHGFNFTRPLASALRAGEIVLDFFAGGGGASEALRQALGRDPDVAVNHDHQAIGMHAANHPFAHHMEADVWTVDILREVDGRPVGWFHASPDCTHFSQAKGGQPRSRATRSLSWVVVKVAGTLARHGLAPRIISLENVRQILGWCPLVAKRDKDTGRVVKIDGTIAARGERVPLREQFLVPDKRRHGSTWRQFEAALRALGYVVEWRILRACDFGAGTSRERLFMVARRDGQPIRWPEPTHGPGRAHPYVTAADCIDWSVPCPSIFERKKPLADATCRRIAKGIHRYVLNAAAPFIVQCANASANGVAASSEPLGVVTAWPKGGAHAVVAPTLVQTGYGERAGQAPRALDLQQPLGTAVGGGVKHALAAAHLVKFRGQSDGADVQAPLPTITSGAGAARPAGAAHAMGILTAFLEQAHGGGENGNPARARGAHEPVSTISTTGSQQRLVTAHMAKLRGTSSAAAVGDPLATISAGGEHHAVVECTLSPEHEAGALRVAAFLMRYHSTGGQHAELGEPITTVTTKDRLALVTVSLHGTPYVIVDIGLRMLRPHELYRAQGFPLGYIIDRTADGTPLSISASVRMVGNSVSPPPLAAIARANLDQVTEPRALAA
ncbi:MAG TPA: DNA cytosine methyltransferase [Frateuria sp.]|uniref:DNA cytosine methyltransferase n=1 Tax=Frateuria sp. TaxID=2211372 RepID=UPI002D7FC3CC|nr:DNA cytosine methyltransferase [Frateuria sp.]HET6805642.1 DNA cytosine methyltransferase [Frateuria sp.]